MKAQASLPCATRQGHPEIWRQKNRTPGRTLQVSDFSTSSSAKRTWGLKGSRLYFEMLEYAAV
ncbi:hypothetical protein B0H19DRAFT_1195850, partial [Mycena capillaripes]